MDIIYRDIGRERAGCLGCRFLLKRIDQRVLGDEAFVERVRERVENRTLTGRRRHGVSLEEIARGIQEVSDIRLSDLRGKGKDSGVMIGRKLFSLAGREYGDKGKEIAEFQGKDPVWLQDI